MKMNFDIQADLLVGVERLRDTLGFEMGDGITVKAVKGDRIGVKLDGSVATLYYRQKHQFYRELGVLVEEAKKSDSFDITEDGQFEMLSAMVDASRGAVPNVKSVKRLIDLMALMGYSMVMLYTEDTVELDRRPYFGYMRGRYTKNELREIDDYAYEYGIEVIPCLECYGHMEKYLFWPEAAPIKDTDKILLAREEATFEFLDELIGEVSSCFRSRRIHIGMDEANEMGRGKFLDKHGYVPAFEIFNEYMARLVEITDKHGLTPMMWSDMYFRVCNGGRYSSSTNDVPPEVADKIPEQVELVYWHYGEVPGADDVMLKRHLKLGRKVIFAGGSWSWIGHFPEHNYAYETTVSSIEACRKNDIKELMMTLWFNDNAECDLFANLIPLSFTAELAYRVAPDADTLRARFETVTGGSYEAFSDMSQYHNVINGDTLYENFHDRFLGKPLFWQDIMEGLYDTHLIGKNMSGHYAAYAARIGEKVLTSSDEWGYLYKMAADVFDYMAIKALIAENLVPAYKAGDKDKLREICDTLIPQLREKAIKAHSAHKAAWFRTNKVLGWANMDIRYAGVVARCDTARALISDYLDGRLDTLEELDEERLDKNLNGFAAHWRIATVNLRI